MPVWYSQPSFNAQAAKLRQKRPDTPACLFFQNEPELKIKRPESSLSGPFVPRVSTPPGPSLPGGREMLIFTVSDSETDQRAVFGEIVPNRSDLYPRQFRLRLDKVRDKLLAELKKYSGNYAFQVRRFDFLKRGRHT
jgi:hypothetical protein